MEEKINFIEPLLERVEEFGKTTYKLVKLKALAKTTDLASSFVSRVITFLVLCMFSGIFTIGLSLWLGELFGKTYYGFFCVAAFYGLVGIILYFMHSRVKRGLSNSIISQMLN